VGVRGECREPTIPTTASPSRQALSSVKLSDQVVGQSFRAGIPSGLRKEAGAVIFDNPGVVIFGLEKLAFPGDDGLLAVSRG
jgi:hypothetical protein